MTTPWLPFPARSHRPAVVCFPPAGAGASFYAPWRRRFRNAAFDVLPVQLPGRETRLSEPLVPELSKLTVDAADALADELPGSYLFFGHSMGAAFAFELAQELEQRGMSGPRSLIVSACASPSFESNGPALRDAPDAELVRLLDRLGSFPPTLRSHTEFISLVIPILRSDIAMCETHRVDRERRINCPLTAISGADDTEPTPQTMSDWVRHTSLAFTQHVVPGGHHYFEESNAFYDLLEHLAIGTVNPGQERR
ncbi:surfactin synthase thioesterase subunit [Amycolatopsis sulphurea]|uniref:Surfactin synthase thioesterase subunit n=1 Tax=Amycolatopsis sulphurea TaxID=76022 RepID=A0A2A9G269_9PSEU|nr:alpha/beta fold hydrolase [Amycolatopsis sulphurea]PFG57036.1 surfactin synthase thioesterase subunit [Amycolatopsis sulphurea]